jgi:hypothetical protein
MQTPPPIPQETQVRNQRRELDPAHELMEDFYRRLVAADQGTPVTTLLVAATWITLMLTDKLRSTYKHYDQIWTSRQWVRCETTGRY